MKEKGLSKEDFFNTIDILQKGQAPKIGTPQQTTVGLQPKEGCKKQRGRKTLCRKYLRRF